MDEALEVATDGLALAVSRLWEDRTHADLTIECHPRQWKVHKAILCSHSDFFKAACQPGRFKEGSDNVITLRSQAEVSGLPTAALNEYDNPEAINVLIYHLYHPNIDYTTLAGIAGMELVLHAWIFAAAEKYDLKGLKLQAVHHTQSLLDEASEDEDIQRQMAESIQVIYLGTAEEVTELKQCLTFALLRNHGQLLRLPAIENAVEDIDGLAYRFLAKATEMVPTGRLPNCSARIGARSAACGRTSTHLMKCMHNSSFLLRCEMHASSESCKCCGHCRWEKVFSVGVEVSTNNFTFGPGGTYNFTNTNQAAASGPKCPICGGPHRARDCPRKKKKKEKKEKKKEEKEEEKGKEKENRGAISKSAARRERQKKKIEDGVRAEAALQHSALEASNAELRQRMAQLADQHVGLRAAMSRKAQDPGREKLHYSRKAPLLHAGGRYGAEPRRLLHMKERPAKSEFSREKATLFTAGRQ
ncbi:hypothetical protein NU219Hw_g2166t1 [Hortaea werneckii]